MGFFHYGNVNGWYNSLGEDPFKLHKRSGHLHEETGIFTGEKLIHYDEDDPHESPKSLALHLVKNRTVQFSILALAIDQIFNDGKGRKETIKTIKKILN